MKSNKFCPYRKFLIEIIKDTITKDASFRFMAKGFSMFPFIKDGDILTISKFNPVNCGIGTVLAFVHPISKKLLIHRLIIKKKFFYFIKGDAVPTTDGWVHKDNILGCITKIERNGKNIWLGLGIEKRLVAFLSKYSFFYLVNRILTKISSFTKIGVC